MKRIISWTTVLGVATLVVGMMGATPARADDDDYGRRDGHHIYSDIADVRRDEARLRDLQSQRRYEARERDWDRVRALDRQIDDLRWHIAHDRRDIHHDVVQVRRNPDRRYDDRQYRDRHDYDRRDRSHDHQDDNTRDDSYRHHE